MVLGISLTILAIMAALFTAISSSYKGRPVDYYQRLAAEAAEAGTAYATACLTLSSHIQTWGPSMSRPDLAPNTNCNGTNSFPSNQYVYSDASLRSYFKVGDLDYSSPFSAQVSSEGFVEVLDPLGNIKKTYKSVKKKMLLWPTEVVAAMSASGTNRTCAIVNHQVYCWGYNAYGQLGNGKYIGSPHNIDTASAVDSLIPVKVRQDPGVMAGKKIVKIFVAQHHSCALDDQGAMYCWGVNSNGQLGDGTNTDRSVPVKVGGALSSKVITDIGGTANSSCAIAEGKIYCWGQNNRGLVGIGNTSGTYNTPQLVSATNTSTTLPTNYTATALSTSGSRSNVMCAIANGKAYCWGLNTVGSVGDNTTTNRSRPTKVYDSGVLSGKTVTAISQDGYGSDADGGLTHVCAVASGQVYCWGKNNYGQLGNNSTTDSSVPVAVNTSGVLSGKTVYDVKVGLRHSCVLANTAVYCWGANMSGQVGDDTTTTRLVPVAVYQEEGKLSDLNVVSIGAGANRGCAVITDGRTFCWGLNTSGQIGDGTLENRRKPTESLFLRPIGNQFIF